MPFGFTKSEAKKLNLKELRGAQLRQPVRAALSDRVRHFRLHGNKRTEPPRRIERVFRMLSNLTDAELEKLFLAICAAQKRMAPEGFSSRAIS